MKESSLIKMGITNCMNDEHSRARSLEDDQIILNSEDGLPALHFNPELVEGSDYFENEFNKNF